MHVDPDRHWALGHRRLSIIDPPGGAQPILDAGSASALVANGMIYNDQQLRREIGEEVFSTATDSESILRSVQHWGVDAAARLDGMFAFVLMHDEGLLAARDPIGIKPLYMGRVGEGIAFASEVKALAGIADDIEEFPAGPDLRIAKRLSSLLRRAEIRVARRHARRHDRQPSSDAGSSGG